MAITDSTWYLDTPDLFVQSVAQAFPADFQTTEVRALVLDGPTVTASGKALSAAQQQTLLLARGLTVTTAELSAALTIIRNRQLFERTLGATRNFYIQAQFTGAPYSQGASIPTTVSPGAVSPASVASVTGPQGIQGDVGPIGNPGPQGIAGPPGQVNLSDATPQATGTAAAGVSTLASRDDHVHALEAHAAAHADGGTDEIQVEALATASGTTTHVLSPDGAGGLVMRAESAGSHASNHENGGGDEISVAGLSGLLADGQTPLAHAASHFNGGADELDIEDFATSSIDTTLVLSPDGGGGVVLRAEANGTWAATLAAGNTSGGSNVIVSSGDALSMVDPSSTFTMGDGTASPQVIMDKGGRRCQPVRDAGGRCGTRRDCTGRQRIDLDSAARCRWVPDLDHDLHERRRLVVPCEC